MGGPRRPVIALLASTLALVACAPPARAPAATAPFLAGTRTPGPPLATPTARVLVRADQTARVSRPSLPGGRDEEAAAGGTSDSPAVGAMPGAGTVAPDFTLRTLDGGTITLSALRGHPVLINFWASWCLPCRAEAPDLQRLYADYRGQGLIVLGVNATQQDTPEDARAFVSEFTLTFPIPMDGGGEAMRGYGVVGLPTSFFVDPRGIIREVIVGQMDRATMVAGLELTKPW